MSTPLVFIDGDQDTTGPQIHECLRNHVKQQDLELLTLPADARKDAQRRAETVNACGIAILYLSSAATRKAVATIANPHVHVIDASSAHRTTPGWVYSFPEMGDEQAQHAAGASHVANPGCYPTGAIGLLRSFVQASLVPADYPISIHTVSDYLGDGCAVVETCEGPEAANVLPFQACGLGLAHKRMPGIQLYTGLTQRPMFIPAYGAYHQDIVLAALLESHRLNAGADATALYAYLTDHYASAPHADIMPLQAPSALPHLGPQALNSTNDTRLGVFVNDHDQVLLTAVFDNLGKGTFDTAVQNLDLMLAQQW